MPEMQALLSHDRGALAFVEAIQKLFQRRGDYLH